MSFATIEGLPDPRRRTTGAIHVPARDGVSTWWDGAVTTVKLQAENTHGSLGLVEVSIPPGAGPGAHAHPEADETFYLPSGELEVLDGDTLLRAGPGDIVHVPRGSRHGFKNVGVHAARILALFTPGGGGRLVRRRWRRARAGEPAPLVDLARWSEPRFIELFRKFGTKALP